MVLLLLLLMMLLLLLLLLLLLRTRWTAHELLLILHRDRLLLQLLLVLLPQMLLQLLLVLLQLLLLLLLGQKLLLLLRSEGMLVREAAPCRPTRWHPVAQSHFRFLQHLLPRLTDEEQLAPALHVIIKLVFGSDTRTSPFRPSTATDRWLVAHLVCSLLVGTLLKCRRDLDGVTQLDVDAYQP